ncbi:MAG TPA: hypothetical protein VN809_10390, partial [Telmatospirillum sp.]|nr:hypothetical protein [Telmatospirillum sp.]
MAHSIIVRVIALALLRLILILSIVRAMMSTDIPPTRPSPIPISRTQLFLGFLKIGLLGFGGV